MNAYQVLGPLVDVLPRPQRLEDAHHTLKMAFGGCLQASGDVVKRQPRDPKLGTHSYFGPNSGVEFKN